MNADGTCPTAPEDLKMRALFFALILTLAASFFATQAQATQSVKLGVNQQKDVYGRKLRVKFLSVVEDSRCPTGANCIWAGNAKIKIRIIDAKGRSKEFELNTNLPETKISYGGYDIELAKLDPHPRAEATNKPAYVATLSVKKA
jgi:hypothetical protein